MQIKSETSVQIGANKRVPNRCVCSVCVFCVSRGFSVGWGGGCVGVLSGWQTQCVYLLAGHHLHEFCKLNKMTDIKPMPQSPRATAICIYK